MVVISVEVLGKSILGLELVSTLLCNVSVCPLQASLLSNFAAFHVFSCLKLFVDIAWVNADYSSFGSTFDDTKEKVNTKSIFFLLQFYNLPQNRSCKKYVKSSVAGIQDLRQSTV